jgi:hypothetical protein
MRTRGSIYYLEALLSYQCYEHPILKVIRDFFLLQEHIYDVLKLLYVTLGENYQIFR